VTTGTTLKEAVVLPYRIRRSAAAQTVPVGGSESYRLGAIVAYFPWRGLALSLALMVSWPWAAYILRLDGRTADLGVWVSLLLGLSACASELLFRRDRLTQSGLEGRSGILGRKIQVPSYEAIESVAVELPGRGSRFDVGDVVIRTAAGTRRLTAVLEPHTIKAALDLQRSALDRIRPDA